MQKKAKYGMNFSNQHHLYSNTSKDLSEKDYYPVGMVMPERNFSYENYAFGFNGMLKDDEVKGSGNSYDFDARMFDTRIARWLSIDPKSSKYPDWSPYIFTFNNPVNFIDPDGQEPIKPQVGTIQQALDYFRQRGFTTVYQIRMFYLKPENEEGVKISQYPRYVYTENNGWIDLQHYFETIAWGRTAMDIMEEAQCAVGMSSCYSYEDLPTNRFAADAPVWSLFFAKYKEADGPMVEVPEKRLKEGEALLNAIEDHFSASGATKPENAPNYSNLPFRKRPKLPDDISEEKRLELINTGKYLPQNYSDRPYDLTKFPEPSPEYKIPKQ